MKNLNDAKTVLRLASQLKFWIQIKYSLVSQHTSTIEVTANLEGVNFSMPIPHEQALAYVDIMILDFKQQIIDLGFDPVDLSNIAITNYY